jgi:S-phase kinase-associated protein 1
MMGAWNSRETLSLVGSAAPMFRRTIVVSGSQQRLRVMTTTTTDPKRACVRPDEDAAASSAGFARRVRLEAQDGVAETTAEIAVQSSFQLDDDGADAGREVVAAPSVAAPVDRVRRVRLEVRDGVAETTVEIAVQSILLRDILLDDDYDDVCVIPLPNVARVHLEFIVNWMTYHHKNPMEEIALPIRSNVMHELCRAKYDADFFGTMSDEDAFDTILAADYIGLEPLLRLGSVWVAAQLKGKSAAEVCKRFGLPEFTDEVHDRVRRANSWIFEVAERHKRTVVA